MFLSMANCEQQTCRSGANEQLDFVLYKHSVPNGTDWISAQPCLKLEFRRLPTHPLAP